MSRDVNLNSREWTNLVFEGKNKEYGAYVLRETSSDRHIKALIIVTIVGMALIYLPNLLKSTIPTKPQVVQSTGVVITDLDVKNDVPEENQIKKMEVVPPPPTLKTTIKFTPPVIVKNEDIKKEDLMLTQQGMTDIKAGISVATVVGVEKGGVDIATIEGHKVVVNTTTEPEIKIHDVVQSMPQFPGGEAELMKWLTDNMVYPVVASERNIQGRVVLRFVVTSDGSIGNVEILRSLDPSCDKEAVRVVKKMPKWIAGKQNGNAVHVYYTLPIQFKLK